jgi:hypothetical protein
MGWIRQKEGDYAKNVIYMMSFTTDEFSALLAETGFTLLGSMRDLDSPEDCHEYYFFRRSAQARRKSEKLSF